MLHMSRVAFGCNSLADLETIVDRRAQGGEINLTTRYLPKRHAEILDGGSMFWIIKHQIVARAAIVAFREAEGGKTDIITKAHVIRVAPRPKRAHQGWRYLEPKDAPGDLYDAFEGADAMPAELTGKLSDLGII
jgi:hypothetical protein